LAGVILALREENRCEERWRSLISPDGIIPRALRSDSIGPVTGVVVQVGVARTREVVLPGFDVEELALSLQPTTQGGNI